MRIVIPHERVSIGLSGRHDLGADDACRSRAVIDHECLSKRACQPLRHGSRREVGAASRRIRNDDADRSDRIVSGCRRSRGHKHQSGADCA